MKKELPKILWANSVNLAGLFSKSPIKCVFVEEYFDNPYWVNKKQDFSVETIGLWNRDNRYIVFSSIDKQEVENWMNGVKSAHSIIHNVVKWGCLKK